LGQGLSEIPLPGIINAYEDSTSKRTKPYDSVLVSLYDLFPKEKRELPEFSDANFMLHFFDKRISAIFISYQEYEAENVKEFIGSAATKLGLPEVGWKYRSIFSASLKCSDFTANLWTGRYESRPIYQAEPTVSFIDDIAEKEQERRRKDYTNALDEAKRKRQAEEAQRLRDEKTKRKIFKP